MELNERIALIVSENQLKQKELAAIIGVTESYISALLNKRNIKPSQTFANIIEEKLGYSAAWVLSGDEPKFKSAAHKPDMSDVHSRLLVALEKMPDNQARAVMAFMNSLEKVEAIFKETDNVIQPPIALEPPLEDELEPDGCTVYEMPASAGLGNYLEADPLSEHYIFPAGTVPPGTDFGVRISGDSMEPTIADGSIVFVEECLELRNGEIGIFSLDGEAYCKELHIDRERQEVRLISHNEDYEPITVAINEYTNLRTVGRVLDWWTKE